MPALAAQVHDRFAKIEIHTAKCDICDQRNTATIYRCLTCGQQTCTPCVNRIGGTDGVHVIKYIIPPIISTKKRKKVLQHKEDKTNVAKRRKTKNLRKVNDADEPSESSDETQSDVGAETPRSYAASRHQKSAEKAEPNSRKAEVNGSSYQPQFLLEEKPQARGPYNYPHTPPSENHTQNKDFLIRDDPVTSHSTASTVNPPRMPAATTSSTYISTIPPYHSDQDGFLALLQAADLIEKMAQRSFAVPAALSTPSPSVSHSSPTTLGNSNSIASETTNEEAAYTLSGKSPYRLPPGQSISESISRDTYTPKSCYHSLSKRNDTMYSGAVRNDTISPQNPPRTLTPYVSDECIFPTPRKLTHYVPARVDSPMELHTRGRKGFSEDKDTKFPVPRRSLTPYIYERPKFPVPPRTGTPDVPEEEKEFNYPVSSQTQNLTSSENMSSLPQDAQPRSPLFVHASSDVDLKTQSSLGLSSQKSRELLAQAAIEAGVERDLFQTEYGKASLQKTNNENDSDGTISINEEECTVIQQRNKRISLVDYDDTEDELELEEVQEDTDW